MSAQDSYAQVTEQVIAALESGTVPWRQPWTTGGWPRSMSTGNRYHGINVMLLGFTNHATSWWGTYNQIQALGGQVQRGQRGTRITFWKSLTVADRDSDDRNATKQIPMLRTYVVFNWDQADWPAGARGLKYAPQTGTAETHQPAEVIAANYLAGAPLAGGPKLSHETHGRAYYQPAIDTLFVPPVEEHRSTAEYYSTLFHEIGHSTGHPSRLNRDGVANLDHFGSGQYAAEELIAEMTAAFLTAETGTATDSSIENSGAYLRSWIKALQNDHKLIIHAAAAGQRAADLVMSKTVAIQPDVTDDSAAA